MKLRESLTLLGGVIGLAVGVSRDSDSPQLDTSIGAAVGLALAVAAEAIGARQPERTSA